MKEAIYTSYEELPLFLNAETLAKLLGVSVSSSYELMHEKKGLSRYSYWLKTGRAKREIAALDKCENRKVRCR